MITTLRIATRESQLAVWQADFVIQAVQSIFPDLNCEKIYIKTSGDKFLEQPLYELGGKALFLKELEEALLDNRADIAVHSMKDIPAEIPPELRIGAVLKRDNPLDAFISQKFASFKDLPAGSKVGTTSLRRKAQLRLMRSDIDFQPLRGNINTRLKKLNSGDYDAIILAACGLKRLNLNAHIRHCFSPDESIPAVGQGVIGIEYAKNRTELNEIMSAVNHPKTFKEVMLERIFQATVGGNCKIPAAGYIEVNGGGYRFYSFLADQTLDNYVKQVEPIQSQQAEKQVSYFSELVRDKLSGLSKKQ